MTDIVERLRVKWDSMGDMANAERDEAAYAIICLRNECAMEVVHTKEIRQQVTDLRAELADMYKKKYNLFLTGNEELERQIDEANAEVEQLRQQRDEAKSKIERIMEGLQGCCMTCEPVGVRNQQMQRDIKTLQDQRDEARREVCAWQGATSGKSFKDTAAVRGWDCFKEDSK